jgi:ribose/xylose/arabinose/galactoside ABC-type transport system permease subunit
MESTPRRRRLGRNTMQILVVLGFLVLLLVVLSIGNPRFLSVRNFINLCRQVAPVIIVGCAMSLVIISGNIDLSIGSTLGFTAVMLGYFCVWGINLYVGLLLLVLIGVGIGFLNWALIDKLAIPAIIATIATMTTIRGLAYTICNAVSVQGKAIKATRVLYSTIFFEKGFPIAIPLVFVVVVIAIFVFLEKRTILGKYSLAMGGNPIAARLSGINVTRIKLALFVLTGVTAAFAGAITTGSMAQGEPNSGLGFEFEVLAACVLGGISIKGGEGSIGRMVIGALIIGILNNGMNMLDISSFFQQVVKGVVLLLAISAYAVVRNQESRMGLSRR